MIPSRFSRYALSVVVLGCVCFAGVSDAQSLCEQLHGLAPGESRRDNVWAKHAHIGVGWHRAPNGIGRESGGGPVREIAFAAERLSVARSCTAAGDYEVTPLPNGLRLGLAAGEGYWSDLLAVSAFVGYLRTGPALRLWVGPELTWLGVSTDSAGVAAGVGLGLGLLEWVAVRVRPAYMVGGRGSYSSGFTLLGVLSISPRFLREHVSEAATSKSPGTASNK